MKYTLHGARLVDAQHDLPYATIVVEDGRIRAVEPAAKTRDQVPLAGAGSGDPIIDVTGMLVLPGFIDLHTHGGGGCNLHTVDPGEIREFAAWVPATGVTSFLIAVVGAPNGLPLHQIRTAVEAIEAPGPGAQPLGIYLEGPYISQTRRGAHAVSWLRIPNAQETESLLAAAGGHLRIIVLAPELPAADEMIRRMVAAGVTVSIGHTDATYDQAAEAIREGISRATHCCNAMRPLLQREPGPLSAIVEAPAVNGELIADGVHVHPAMMRLVIKLLGPERTIVITDALAGAGVPGATFEFAGQRAHVEHGVARLADGTITGSVLTMDQALRNLLDMTAMSLPEAVGMLTANPARALGVGDRKGLLVEGYDADLVLLDGSLTLQATVCDGTLAHAGDDWRERLTAFVAGEADAPGAAPGVQTTRRRRLAAA